MGLGLGLGSGSVVRVRVRIRVGVTGTVRLRVRVRAPQDAPCVGRVLGRGEGQARVGGGCRAQQLRAARVRVDEVCAREAQAGA